MHKVLYYKDLEVGQVTPAYSDFPGFSGTFTLTLQPGSSQSARILSFIDLSCREDAYYQHEEPDEMKELAFSREAESYLDLIECNDWVLVSESGERTNILVPVFGNECNISWRLNVF